MLLATSTSAHVDGAPADHKCLPPGVEHLSDESLAKELAACFLVPNLKIRFFGDQHDQIGSGCVFLLAG